MLSCLRLLLFSYVLTTFATENAFSQTNSFITQENRLIALYSKISTNSANTDSYSDQFGNEFRRFIKTNPATIAYPFNKLISSTHCYIRTSSDGKFRVYSWDTWTGGTMHFFNQIYQWKANGKVFTKYPKYEEGDAGNFCSKIYTVAINNKAYYLTISNGIYSTKDVSQSISVYTIDDNKLVDTVELFKTKSSKLNRIDVEFDFFSVVDRPERPLELITYDDRQKIVYIPVVDENGKVSKRNILYQLKGNYFEFTGIKTGKQ